MRQFLITLFLFLGSLFLFAAMPIAIQLWSKEDFYNLDRFIEKTPSPSLVGYAYNEENYRYLKYKTILQQEAVEVMAIGSSRVLQFRQEMFTTSFYNAGYVIETIADVQQFLSILPPEKLPDYLIIGLDQWMFNRKDNILRPHPPAWWQNNLSLNRKKSVQNFLRIYRDMVQGKINPIHLPELDDNIFRVGLYAHLDSSGFRQDGSFYYGRQIRKRETGDSTASDYQFAETLRRVKNGVIGFEHGDQLNQSAVDVFEKCVQFCQHHHIKVVCLLPPFADVVYQRMVENGNHTYLQYVEPALRQLASTYPFEFYVYNNVSACGSDDGECIDGRHGSEKTYARLLLDILDQNSVLNNVCCRDELRSTMNTAQSHYQIFPPH